MDTRSDTTSRDDPFTVAKALTPALFREGAAREADRVTAAGFLEMEAVPSPWTRQKARAEDSFEEDEEEEEAEAEDRAVTLCAGKW